MKFIVFLLFVILGGGQSSYVIDVNDFGAKPDGGTDNKMAFLSAWTAACTYRGHSILRIPEGVYLLTKIEFSGPCNASIAVQQEGRLKSPSSASVDDQNFWIQFRDLTNFTFDGLAKGSLDGNGEKDWSKHGGCKSKDRCPPHPVSLKFVNINDGIITNITLLDSKSFHMKVYKSNNFHIHFLNIKSQEKSPNTDGIHVSKSSNVNISSSVIGVGDDCISIGPGAFCIFISNVSCGLGHGISVGILGKYENEDDVKDLIVKNCTLNSTSNGLRIKTWPTLKRSRVHNLTFEDIVVRNVAHPILIDHQYCPGHDCNSTASHVQIKGVTFANIRGSSKTKIAMKFLCSSVYPCENIKLLNINLTYIKGDASSICSNAKGVSLGIQNPKSCF